MLVSDIRLCLGFPDLRPGSDQTLEASLELARWFVNSPGLVWSEGGDELSSHVRNVEMCGLYSRIDFLEELPHAKLLLLSARNYEVPRSGHIVHPGHHHADLRAHP